MLMGMFGKENTAVSFFFSILGGAAPAADGSTQI